MTDALKQQLVKQYLLTPSFRDREVLSHRKTSLETAIGLHLLIGINCLLAEKYLSFNRTMSEKHTRQAVDLYHRYFSNRSSLAVELMIEETLYNIQQYHKKQNQQFNNASFSKN